MCTFLLNCRIKDNCCYSYSMSKINFMQKSQENFKQVENKIKMRNKKIANVL